jgi:hypothetical protein
LVKMWGTKVRVWKLEQIELFYEFLNFTVYFLILF